MADLLPFYHNRVVVRVNEGEHTLNLPEDMDSLKFKIWKNKAGGIFSKDLLRWMREKDHGQYFIVKSENMQSIIRLINEDDVIHFNSLGLLNGKIKDSYYMHLKTVGINQNIRGSERYIDESTSNSKKIKTELETKEIEHDDESYQSKSLFE